MSHDALFRFGMGSVLLNASQKEEAFAPRALKACVEAVEAQFSSQRIGLATFAVTDLFRPEMKRRANSAKALDLRAGSAVVPSKS